VGGRYGFGTFVVSGSVSASVTNTRTSDYSGKYTCHVQADQPPPAEGMSQMMDIIASTIAPIPFASGR
jgi:hypothetical protein